MLRRQMRDQAVRVLTATMSTLARRLAGLARACHPEPTVAVTAVAAGLALAVGHRGGDAALVTATIAASQLAVGWATTRWTPTGTRRPSGPTSRSPPDR